MRIKNIRLKNGYKRFEDLTIDLGDSPTKLVALVGPNGSGKSSVFEGMLYRQNQYGVIGARANDDFKFHSRDGNPQFSNSREQNVEIIFNTGDFHTVAHSKQNNGDVRTMFNFRSPYRYSSNLKVNTLQAVADIKNNNIGAGSTIHIDDKVTDNYQRLYSLVDRTMKAGGTYEQAKEKILGELNSSLLNVLNIEIFDHGDILDGKGTLFFKKSDQNKEFEFDVLSSGEKEVVDILIDLYLKKEKFVDSIYIIDEPELHINTNIQRKLLNEIVKIIPDTCQLWIATHSIGFLNALKQDHANDSSIIWFKGNFAKEETVLTPILKTRENWRMIFETALEDLTGLLSPETIIYCEGRKEPNKDGKELGFDAKIYNQIFELEFPNTLFVSSGGGDEPEKYAGIALKVLTKAFDNVTLLVLQDKDINGSGNPTTDEQREEWIKKNPSVNRMLRRKEIENYLFDFEILKKIKNDIDEEYYKGIVSDVVNGEIKDTVSTELKKYCGFEQMNKEEFKILLASQVKPDTNVYKELSDVIFS